jgi:hypothetical protein
MSGDLVKGTPRFIKRLMSYATDVELAEAAAVFDEYMGVVWEIFERIKREKNASDSPKSLVCDRIKNLDV